MLPSASSRSLFCFIKLYKQKGFRKLHVSIIDFYRKVEEGEDSNPFALSLTNPVFCILMRVDGKVREVVLRLSGEVACPLLGSCEDFTAEGYRDYTILTDFLLGEKGEALRKRWGFSEEEFRELIFKLYFTLIREHSTCSFPKKFFLLLVGIWKFIVGRKI